MVQQFRTPAAGGGGVILRLASLADVDEARQQVHVRCRQLGLHDCITTQTLGPNGQMLRFGVLAVHAAA